MQVTPGRRAWAKHHQRMPWAQGFEKCVGIHQIDRIPPFPTGFTRFIAEILSRMDQAFGFSSWVIHAKKEAPAFHPDAGDPEGFEAFHSLGLGDGLQSYAEVQYHFLPTNSDVGREPFAGAAAEQQGKLFAKGLPRDLIDVKHGNFRRWVGPRQANGNLPAVRSGVCFQKPQRRRAV